MEQVPQIDHEKLANDIISFRKEVLNLDKRKSGELITLDSAILIMEASFNFHHGVYNKNYTEIMYDSVIIETTYTNESEISIGAVQNLYVEINNAIYSVFEKNTFPNKTIKFVDIYFKNIDGVNYIKTLLAIGYKSMQKSGTIPDEGLYPNVSELWRGETPFNDRIGQTWDIGGEYNTINTAFAGHFGMDLPANDFTNAINNEIILEHGSNNGYIYYINTISTQSSSAFSYAEIYENSQHITPPNEESHVFFFWVGIWDIYGSKWVYQYADNNGDLIILEEPPVADYKKMNKYYNVCLAYIDYFKPRYKEPVDCNFVVGISDYRDSPTWYYRWLMANIYVTYASSSPMRPFNPAPIDFITPFAK